MLNTQDSSDPFLEIVAQNFSGHLYEAGHTRAESSVEPLNVSRIDFTWFNLREPDESINLLPASKSETSVYKGEFVSFATLDNLNNIEIWPCEVTWPPR